MENSHPFKELRTKDVNSKIEKKNGLSYLSWAWAVDTLLQEDPAATWDYKEDKRYGDTVMVFCTVTAFGKSMTAQLPVMNYMNKAIPNPDAFAVNTAMQRCLAKAIALHGIGLYIYAGEDIPNNGTEIDDSMVNTGVRIPAGFSKMTPEEQQERIGAGNVVRGTETGKFIFAPKQGLESFSEEISTKPGKTQENASVEATGPSEGAVDSPFITHTEQLEIVRLAKEKGIHHLSMKKMLKDEFGVDGSAKLTQAQYPKVIESIIRFDKPYPEVGK